MNTSDNEKRMEELEKAVKSISEYVSNMAIVEVAIYELLKKHFDEPNKTMNEIIDRL